MQSKNKKYPVEILTIIVLFLIFILGLIFAYIWNIVKFGFTPQNIFITIILLSFITLIFISLLIKRFFPKSKIGETIKNIISELGELVINLITFN